MSKTGFDDRAPEFSCWILRLTFTTQNLTHLELSDLEPFPSAAPDCIYLPLLESVGVGGHNTRRVFGADYRCSTAHPFHNYQRPTRMVEMDMHAVDHFLDGYGGYGEG